MTRSVSERKIFQARTTCSAISSYPLNVRFDNYLSRIYCHTCSMGFSSSEYGGNGIIVRFLNSQAISPICQLTRSTITTAYLPSSVVLVISCKYCHIIFLFKQGAMIAYVFPIAGQAESNSC
nr:hypothetical protein [Pseudoalteromonas sp. NBT06-2]